MLVFGTRPEAIKMAPLVKQFQQDSTHFETVVCVTAQHREMLDQVLKLFDIIPQYDLDIMQKGQDLYDVTSRVLLGMRDILKKENPQLVLVHGDTATSTAAALAAFYQQIPVGHIEAGLRTHNIYSPWPEEMNRQITSRLATWHFAPTPLSRENLLAESVADTHIHVVGNTVIDALHTVLQKIQASEGMKKEIEAGFNQMGLAASLMPQWRQSVRKLVLITGHRRENFGEGFIHICEAIKTLAQQYPIVDFVYPMHLNPQVRKPVYEILGDHDQQMKENIHLIEPLDYLPFVYLMNHATLILTDSGGIQEEAPGLGKPVLVMRDTTERPEAVAAGTVKLVGTDYHKIVQGVQTLLNEPQAYEAMSKATNPYGDGLSAVRIGRILR